MVIGLLCYMAFDPAYCSRLLGLVQNGSGGAGCRYCYNDRHNNHHVLFPSSAARGKVTVISFL
jgi:hypothetical protein